MGIGGTTAAIVQQKAAAGTVNAIGEKVIGWIDLATLHGWLDLANGDSKYTHNAKLQESTHIFMCDYCPLERFADNKRLVVNGLVYDVLLIDDPMEMHQQLEIYLRYVGR